MDLITALTKTGLTGQEALIYVELCRSGPLTGYEASKLTGISKSNVYLSLASLAEKGGAWRIDGDAISYTAVPPEQYLAAVGQEFQDALRYLKENLPQTRPTPAPFLTVLGNKAIMTKLTAIVDGAKMRVYLSLAKREIEALKASIEAAITRGIKVVIISDSDWIAKGAKCLRIEKKPGQIRAIADTEEVLTGEIQGDGGYCLYSRNLALVALIKDSLINEMRLIDQASPKKGDNA